MTIREQIEQREQEILSPYACLSVNSRGRERLEENLLNLIRKDALDHGIKDEEIELVDVYIKPEEQLVYYVINKEISGSIAF